MHALVYLVGKQLSAFCAILNTDHRLACKFHHLQASISLHSLMSTTQDVSMIADQQVAFVSFLVIA